MTKAVRIVVPGDPIPKGRARFANGHAYTPARTRAYEETVGLYGKMAMKGEPPWTGPVNLTVSAHLAVPKSWPASKRAMALTGQIQPTVRIDLSNIVKAAEDGLNGIAFKDDSQVVNIVANKKYSETPALVLYLVPA